MATSYAYAQLSEENTAIGLSVHFEPVERMGGARQVVGFLETRPVDQSVSEFRNDSNQLLG